MVITDTVQALSAAFSFGVLFQAASGGLLLFYRGHGSQIRRDSRRLVLVLFLLFAALWAQLEFLNIILPPLDSTPCQITLIFTTTFDQLARVSIEQYLLLSVGAGKKLTAGRMVLQGILLLRTIAGGLLIGFTRPSFAPTCSARISIMPISIVTLSLDGFIIGVLLVRALSIGVFRDMGNTSSTTQNHSKASIFTIFGVVIWLGASVPMILGFLDVVLLLRTVLPANGILILVGILTYFSGSLVKSGGEEAVTPEARSPFITPMAPSREINQSMAGDRSPVSAKDFKSNRDLFVINPSPNMQDYVTSSKSDTRGFMKLADEEPKNEWVEFGEAEAINRTDYRRSSGIFASPLSQGTTQGAVAPQIRAENRSELTVAASIPPKTARPKKRGLFGKSAKTVKKPTIRELGISNPIASSATGHPMAQPFARIATIDLEQAVANDRERRAGAAVRSRLIASRPAPRPPVPITLEELKNTLSMEQNERPIEELLPSSSPGAEVASTTSASVSPGRDEVRRRSPMDIRNFDIGSEKTSDGISNPPLQKKSTSGLPSNPRSRRFTMAKKALKEDPPTVMFMNHIVYNDPGLVEEITKQSTATQKSREIMYGRSHWSTADTIKSTKSIVHRPRPIKRLKDEERSIYPSGSSMVHKRSKSGSSISLRKTRLMSSPGSPTDLPPLPPAPSVLPDFNILKQSTNKSMTFDEKVDFLFPVPPSRTGGHKRRSSVPSLVPMPSIYMVEIPIASPEVLEQATRALEQTAVKPNTVPAAVLREDMQLLGSQAYQKIINKTEASGKPANQDALSVPLRQSIIDEVEKLSDSNRSQVNHSVISDAPPQNYDLTHSVLVAESADVPLPKKSGTRSGKIKSRMERRDSAALFEFPLLGIEAERKNITTVILDSEENRKSRLVGSQDGQITFMDSGKVFSGNSSSVQEVQPVWHRRVGDVVPSFSARKSVSGLRKMPPPAPLLLGKKGGNAKGITRPVGPSPVDTPGRAIAEIQAQLQRLEDPSPDSLNSLLRQLPEENPLVDRGQQQLLENLEREMGEQANQWQQMQTNLDRDSLSVIMTPQHDESVKGVASRPSSQISSQRSWDASRISALRSQSDESGKAANKSTSGFQDSRARTWQKSIAETENEYAENASSLVRNKSLNFSAISTKLASLMAPPNSIDSGTKPDAKVGNELLPSTAWPQPKQNASLWKEPATLTTAAFCRLWNPPYESTAVIPTTEEPPAKGLRPTQRRGDKPLVISSTQLWSEPTSSTMQPVIGMWRSQNVRAKSSTMRKNPRPGRKTTRMTFLPDILKNPVALPDKAKPGTFRFPWGETSDQPISKAATSPLTTSSSMVNTQLGSRANPEFSDSAVSFVDEYETEMDGDSEIYSGDDFDETTLWEIANLLETKNVSSMQNSPPPTTVNIIEDHDKGSVSDSENEKMQIGYQAPNLPIQPLNFSPSKQKSAKQEPKLWSQKSSSAIKLISIGLPQSEPFVWNSIIPGTDGLVRSKPHSQFSLPVLATSDLWSVSKLPEKKSQPLATKMWENSFATTTTVSKLWELRAGIIDNRRSSIFTAPTQGLVIRSTPAAPAAIMMFKKTRKSTGKLPTLSSKELWVRKVGSREVIPWMTITQSRVARIISNSEMWSPISKISPTPNIVGLYDASVPRISFRETDTVPAALNMTRTPQISRSPVAQLTSTKLWSRCTVLRVERDWISESSVRPDSPTFSTSSSGNTSPVSDSSSIKSTSTKASSIWSSLTITNCPTIPWIDTKNGNNSSDKSPVDDSARPSRISPFQKSLKSTPLASVRESRVLASHDIWEAREASEAITPILKTPRKFRNGSITQQLPVPNKKLALPNKTDLRPQYRPAMVLRADWDTALLEAIAAGKSYRRVQWSDWASALDEALSQSKPSMQRPTYTSVMWENSLREATDNSLKGVTSDSAILHPDFVTESRASRIVTGQSAAISHASKIYDEAVVHPHSFIEMVSSDVYPAGIGHVVNLRSIGMWSAKPFLPTQKNSKLWSKGSYFRNQEPELPQMEGDVIRKRSVSRSLCLPVLESRNIWQPSLAKKVERNWIAVHVDVHRIWTAPTRAVASFEKDSVQTWTAKPSSFEFTPDIFSHITTRPVNHTSTRRVSLARLHSNQLFRKRDTKECITHWLQATSGPSFSPRLAVKAASSETGTWSASPEISAKPTSGMWEAKLFTTPVDDSLFSNLHSEPWSRPKRDVAKLSALESTDLWSSSRNLPPSPRNWLI